MARSESTERLRRELEERIRSGRCAYCRRAAEPERPLTREHVIPRARGGRRKDVRIIVPACARCNHHRGCQELVVFLLRRPRRISAFLDYLGTLSPESVQEMDIRVFADLYAAVWMLNECAGGGREWRAHLAWLCSGRALHRRRYAARRMVGAVGGRLESMRERGVLRGGPGCPVPGGVAPTARMQLDEPLDQLGSRLLGLLSLVWEVPAEDVRREMERQVRRSAERSGRGAESDVAGDDTVDTAIVALDGWSPRGRARRLRVDRRGGRARPPGQARGRAA